MPKLVVLDESSSQRHPIISVGGFVIELADVPAVESAWRAARQRLGIKPDVAVKYSMTWTRREHRAELIRVIGKLPVAAVVALLEDFRPRSYKLSRERRSERFIHLPAFDYVLQRMVEQQYCGPHEPGPHFVAFDLRDDFSKLADHYVSLHGRGWQWGSRTLPSLASYGYSPSLIGADRGPLIEIADLLVSATTRWAGFTCAAHKRQQRLAEQDELDTDMSALLSRFPTSPVMPTRRRGISVIVHRAELTGKELLHAHVDDWLNQLHTSAALPEDF